MKSKEIEYVDFYSDYDLFVDFIRYKLRTYNYVYCGHYFDTFLLLQFDKDPYIGDYPVNRVIKTLILSNSDLCIFTNKILSTNLLEVLYKRFSKPRTKRPGKLVPGQSLFLRDSVPERYLILEDKLLMIS